MNKNLNNYPTRDLTLGEARQALRKCSEELIDYVELYNKEYAHSKLLQNRINTLKSAQRNAHLEFRGCVE